MSWDMQVAGQSWKDYQETGTRLLRFQTKESSFVLSAAEQSSKDVKKVGDMIRAASERCFDISECFLAKSEVLGGIILCEALTLIHSISTSLLNSPKTCVCVKILAG